MRQGLFPICIICAVTAASSRKNFDKPSIATEKSFCNSKGFHSRSKQCLRIYKDHFALQNACWEIPNPWTTSDGCRLRAFCKTLFQHTAGMRSHHGIVMITGIGIASQQAEPARQIFNAVRVLAFVRTKALLAGENIPWRTNENRIVWFEIARSRKLLHVKPWVFWLY